MRRFFAVFIVMLCFVAIAPASAQSSPFDTTPYRQINLFAGPGITFRLLNRIQSGVPMTIIERNASGTWVRIQRHDDKGVLLEDGWVISGYLNLAPDFQFGDVPVNSMLPDADAASDMSNLHDLYLVPVIPTISDAMREVFQRGRDEFGRYPHVITKVGDSITADPLYLQPMSSPNWRLGAYSYLEETIRYFGASTAVESIAARIGMTTYTVFDPGWAAEPPCEPRETPLDCEYRRKQPSISFIMFGPNDLLAMSDTTFDTQIRRIVERTLEQGIIPVLSTFSYDPGMGLWQQSINFNRRLVAIAAEYQVPIINLWLAARALPEYGLEVDHIHMKHWGTTFLKFDTGNVAFSGASLRNLLTIRTLNEIRNTVILPAQQAAN